MRRLIQLLEKHEEKSGCFVARAHRAHGERDHFARAVHLQSFRCPGHALLRLRGFEKRGAQFHLQLGMDDLHDVRRRFTGDKVQVAPRIL